MMNKDKKKTTDYIPFLSVLPAGATISSCKTLGDIYFYWFTWPGLVGAEGVYYAGEVQFTGFNDLRRPVIDGVSGEGRYFGLDKGEALEVFVGQGAGEILMGAGSVQNRDKEPMVTVKIGKEVMAIVAEVMKQNF